MENVLVTGGAGFIGTNLIKNLLDRDVEVISLDDYSTGSETNEFEKASYLKMDIEEIENTDPDVIILMPCGFDVQRTLSEYEKYLRNDTRWNQLRSVKEKKVFAVDANSFFSKPSIRTVTGIEILAKILHSNIFSDLQVPINSFLKI